MKKFSLVLLALFCFQAQAIRTLSFDERKLETEFDRLALQEKWTFATDVTAVGNPEYGKGYLGPSLDLPFVDFDPSVDVYSVDLRDKTKFKAIRNQGSCGSCVVFAVNGAWTITMQLRNLVFPDLSEGHLMNCGGNGGQCNGDYGDRVSERLDKLQTLFPLSVYPYVTSSGSCKEKNYSGPRYGKISEFKNVGTSVRELGAALNAGYAVAGGVAADRYYQAYRGGVYNPQSSSMSVNHYTVLIGLDCETSVDASGKCKFDGNGNLPAGVGKFITRNSWGGGWGQGGYMVSKITDSRGRRINAMYYGRGNAQIYETGIPITPPSPVTFKMKGSSDLEVTVRPSVFDAEQIKSGLIQAGFTSGD